MTATDHGARRRRVLTICGSLRAGSYNGMLLAEAARVAPDGFAFEAGRIDDLPLFDSDVEAGGLPEPARRLREQIRAADAVMIATPEYNHSLPGGLKNALDCVSRPLADPVTARKPVAIVGAGGRLGAARAQYDLRRVCAAMGMLPMHQPELFVVEAWKRFSPVGALTDPGSHTALADLMAAFAAWIDWTRDRPSPCR